MHLTIPDEDMTKNQTLNTSGCYQNEYQTENIALNKYIFSDTEPRAVYIALRESKLSTTMQQEVLIEKGTGNERYNIMPVLNNDAEGDDIEYVTLEECRLIPEENVVSEGTHFNVNGMTDLSHLRDTIHNAPGVNVLVQPVFTHAANAQEIEFNEAMQPNQQQINNTNLSPANIISSDPNLPPMDNFNPSLPTEPLPYEETMTIEKCVMDVTSPNLRANNENCKESVGSPRNRTYMDSFELTPLRCKEMQNQHAIYPSHITCEESRFSNGRNKSSQLCMRKNEFEQTPLTDCSPEITFKQGSSPPLSSSPTYSLPESPHIYLSAATNNKSSRRVSTQFDSAGSVSPSASSTSSGSQMSSSSSTSKSTVLMENKRIRKYSESAIVPRVIVPSNRARHQSDGNLNCRTRMKKSQASRRGIGEKVDNLTRNYIAKRRSKHPMPEGSKDDKYWRRRAKNNEAAKRSRESKRQKEDEVLQRVERLERENTNLRDELKEALSKIRMLQDQLERPIA